VVVDGDGVGLSPHLDGQRMSSGMG
jgi:hypothetical protein